MTNKVVHKATLKQVFRQTGKFAVSMASSFLCLMLLLIQDLAKMVMQGCAAIHHYPN